jgi:hypothetical protein
MGLVGRFSVFALYHQVEVRDAGRGTCRVGDLTEELCHIPLAMGWHPVRIYGDRPKERARFTVLSDREGAGS